MSDIDDFRNLGSQVFAEYLQFILVFSLKIDYEFRSIFRSYLKCYRFELVKSLHDTIRIIGTNKYGASCDNQLRDPDGLCLQAGGGHNGRPRFQSAGKTDVKV